MAKIKSSTRVYTNDPKNAPQLLKMGEKLTQDAAKITKDGGKMTKDAKGRIIIKSSNVSNKQALDIADRVQHRVFHFVRHLQDWIEKNSLPKRYNFSKWFIRREHSRWAKRGPMTRKDWVRFYNWAAKNAAPKPVYVRKTKTGCDQCGKKTEPKEPIDYDELMRSIEKLARPRKPRKIYEYPPEPDYPYTPQLDPKKPPRKDRGRPFDPPEVPTVFQHIDLETDFWSKVRFPLRPSTASYNPSENILKLAKPRVVPPAEPHCPIPEKPVEYVAPRRRMSPRQWKEHQRRLEFLARPVYRPVIDLFYD